RRPRRSLLRRTHAARLGGDPAARAKDVLRPIRARVAAEADPTDRARARRRAFGLLDADAAGAARRPDIGLQPKPAAVLLGRLFPARGARARLGRGIDVGILGRRHYDNLEEPQAGERDGARTNPRTHKTRQVL